MSAASDLLSGKLKKAGIDSSSLSVICESPDGEVFSLTTNGNTSISLWKQLREIVPQMESWPVILGKSEDGDALNEQVQEAYHGTTKTILDAASAIVPGDWFSKRQDEVVDELLEFGGDLYKGSPDGESSEIREEYRGIPRGPWPEGLVPNQDFIIPTDLITRKPLPTVHIALIPTSMSWQVPAYLRFGSFNECPSPAEHVALMKFWSDQYGAEIVGVTSDTVEMMVRRPPKAKNAAMQLAKQQYLYCADIVDQGTETLAALAATLLGGSVWFFWWD